MTRRALQAWTLGAALSLSLLAISARAAEPRPVEVTAQGVVDGWENLAGGVSRGPAYVQALEVRLDRMFATSGTRFSISGLQIAAAGPSSRRLGDLQTADNKEASSGVRLYELWVRQTLRGGYLKGGVVDLNSEFNVTEVGGLFVSGAQGLGLELGQVGESGPSVYPAPRLGGLAAASHGDLTLKAGVFDGLSQGDGPEHRNGSGAEHGLLGIVEASRTIRGGGRLSAGLWRHSGNFGSTLEPVRRRVASGGYVMLEQTLWRGERRTLRGLARVGTADAKTEQLGLNLTGDLVLDRPFFGQDGELLGLGMVTAMNGDHAMARLAGGEDQRRRSETAIEVTYRAPISPHLFLQPDVQYILHPGAVRGHGDALLVGLRLGFSWLAVGD